MCRHISPGGSKFQFQCGAIEGKISGLPLKAFLLFQFQCGAIEGLRNMHHCTVQNHFNSSVVRLRERRFREIKETLWHFNSSVVRLRVAKIKQGSIVVFKFQFQCGAIEGICQPLDCR